MSIEFSRRNRKEWQYWYGPYIQWAFFIHLTALIFLLTTICCPEWAYGKNNIFVIFFELGLFKQCFLGLIYQRTLTTLHCTLSDTGNNQSEHSIFDLFVDFFLLRLIFRLGQSDTGFYLNGIYHRNNSLVFNDYLSKRVSSQSKWLRG